MNPRVLFVGRGRITLPLAPWVQKKWDVLGDQLELRMLNAGTGTGDARFHLLPWSKVPPLPGREVKRGPGLLA